MFAKARDCVWGREQGADQESEEVSTFTLATRPMMMRRRLNIAGNAKAILGARHCPDAFVGASSNFCSSCKRGMSIIAHDARGHAVMVRTDKRDFIVDERHQFVAAVEKEIAEGRKEADSRIIK